MAPGTEGRPLAELVDAQAYRLSSWREAGEALNYRRFFDVTSLVAVRVEDPVVFMATHALLLALHGHGAVDGFRIDHPDGLADPRGYFRRLSMATGGAWIVAEKILEADEAMPEDWPVAGTTGYDASWRIGALNCDPNGIGDLGSIAHQITGDIPGTLDEVIEAAKREITTTSLLAEVHRIAELAYQICRDDIMLRDHTQGWIAKCLTELVIAFPHYRAYVVPGEPAPDEAVELIEQTAEKALLNLDPDLHDTLEVVVDLVLGREVGSRGWAQRDQRDELIVRFQQVCGAVTAKGVEDTAFYRWTHLVSLNEVGGSPATWGLSTDEFHRWCTQKAEARPATMTCGTTHDTKRSEDVRARITVLSQYSGEWKALLTRLHPYAEGLEGHTENLMWQTIAGTWTDAGPISAERLVRYLVKAAREQKIWTNWTGPDDEAEQALADLVASLYADEDVLGAFADWYEFTADTVRTSVLSRKAIQLTCLGVADCYQSTETTQNYLVDPDNRGAADFAGLARQVRRLHSHEPTALADEKLHLTRQILRLRRRRPDAFVGAHAAYRPIPSSSGHVLAFARGAEPQVVTVAARLGRAMEAPDAFAGHTVVLPAGRWFDVLTGEEFDGGSVDLGELLDRFPVAVLEEVSNSESTGTLPAVIGTARPARPPARAAVDPAADGGLLGWLTRALRPNPAEEPGRRGTDD